MVYDQSIDTSVYTSVPANVVIRSQAGQEPLKSGKQAVSDMAKDIVTTSNHNIDVKKFARYLQGITRVTSTKKCARSVRIGLQTAGAKFSSHPVAAADWGATLQKIGYRKINQSFDNPQKGDIYIIDRNPASRYGHIAAYSGSAWVSDFKQRSHAVYGKTKVKYTYYRLGS